MREHLGIDVDEVMEQDVASEVQLRKMEMEMAPSSPYDHDNRVDLELTALETQDEKELLERRHRLQDEFLARSEHLHSFNHDVDWEQANNPNLKSNRKLTADSRVTRNLEHRKDLDGEGADHMKLLRQAGQGDGRDSYLGQDSVEFLVSDVVPEGRGKLKPFQKGKACVQQAAVEKNKQDEKCLSPAQDRLCTGLSQLRPPVLSQ